MTTKNTVPILQAPQAITDERQLMLDLLSSYKVGLIAEKLRQKGHYISPWNRRDKFENRLKEMLDNNDLNLGELVQILNQLEGWGKQQIYLYRFSGGQGMKQQWLNPQWVQDYFQRLGLLNIFNNARPIVMPDQPELISVDYEQVTNKIRFIWAQKQINLQRAIDQDPPAGKNTLLGSSTLERIVLHAYRETTTRGMITFDWDIESDEAILTIRKLTNTDYVKTRNDRIKDLEKILPISDFKQVAISGVVTRLSQSNEINRRQIRFQSLNNEGTMIFSSGDENDVFTDTVLEQARAQVIDSVTGLSGTIRWNKPNNKPMTLEIYGRVADDQRIGIASQELEEDIRHVLRRVRTYCQ